MTAPTIVATSRFLLLAFGALLGCARTPAVDGASVRELLSRHNGRERRLDWVFVDEVVPGDGWYTGYSRSDIKSRGGDRRDYFRTNDLCYDSETGTYTRENCDKLPDLKCEDVEQRAPDAGSKAYQPSKRMANITEQEKEEDEMGPGKLCINRIAFPYEPKGSTRSYVLAAKCIPKWENCDKCLCGLLKDVDGADKGMDAVCQYAGQATRGSVVPNDDFWGFEDCTYESLSSITLYYGWVSVEPLTGDLEFDAIGHDAPYEDADEHY